MSRRTSSAKQSKLQKDTSPLLQVGAPAPQHMLLQGLGGHCSAQAGAHHHGMGHAWAMGWRDIVSQP